MVLQQRRLTIQAGIAAMLAAVMLSLTGCGNFFVYPGSLTSTTTSGDYAYVSNSTTGSTYINGYTLSSGLLVASSSSPYSVNVTPSALAITPNNNILYIGSELNSGIYAWAIGTGGTLTEFNSGSAVAGLNPVSIDISPDGQWLFALDATSVVSEYSINYSLGTLSLQAQVQISVLQSSGATLVPYQIHVAPTGSYVGVALGDGGLIVFPFTTSSGTLGSSYSINATNVPSGADFTAIMDGSNNLYAGQTGGTTPTLGVNVYQLGSTSATEISGSTFGTGAGPKSLVLSSGYSYLYSGNQTDSSLGSGYSTITEFSQSSGTLTLVQTIAAPYFTSAIGRDNSGKYVLAAGYNTTGGLEMYSIGTGGALSAVSNAATAASTTLPVAMALTH